MTIYDPVTEWGKMIASLLKYDDQVRLDIHEYLEKAEPEWMRLNEQAQFLRDTIKVLADSNENLKKKLGSVRQIVDEWGRQRDDPYGMECDWYYKDKYFALKKALGDEA